MIKNRLQHIEFDALSIILTNKLFWYIKIGGFTSGVKDDYEWVDGTKMDWTSWPWADDQPDNWQGRENRLEFWDTKLNDENKDHRRYDEFACKQQCWNS